MKITTIHKNKAPIRLSDKSSLRQLEKIKPSFKTAALIQTPAIKKPSEPQQKNEKPPNPLPSDSLLLKKGQKTALPANSAKLKVHVESTFVEQILPCRIDTEVFLLSEHGQVPGEDWFVFYNQPESPDKAVLLQATNNDSDFSEELLLDLTKLDRRINKLVFIATLDQAQEKNYNFSLVQKLCFRIVDSQNNKEILRFEPPDYYRNVISMVIGEIYLYKNEWRFNPVGDGTAEGLEKLCEKYGIETA